jgi:DNA-binding transcriptional LysR family regulator
MMGDAIARFHHAYPTLGVDVRHLSTGDQTAALRQGNIDVAFGYLMSQETGEIVGELFRNDPFIGVLLPAGSPLAAKSQLWLRELGGLPLTPTTGSLRDWPIGTSTRRLPPYRRSEHLPYRSWPRVVAGELPARR